MKEHRLEKGIHYYAIFAIGQYGGFVRGKLPYKMATTTEINGYNFYKEFKTEDARNFYKELVQNGFEKA